MHHPPSHFNWFLNKGRFPWFSSFLLSYLFFTVILIHFCSWRLFSYETFVFFTSIIFWKTVHYFILALSQDSDTAKLDEQLDSRESRADVCESAQSEADLVLLHVWKSYGMEASVNTTVLSVHFLGITITTTASSTLFTTSLFYTAPKVTVCVTLFWLLWSFFSLHQKTGAIFIIWEWTQAQTQVFGPLYTWAITKGSSAAPEIWGSGATAKYVGPRPILFWLGPVHARSKLVAPGY